MPRWVQDDTVMNDKGSFNGFDLNVAQQVNLDTFKTDSRWFSDNNSWNTSSLLPNQSFRGEIDIVAQWDYAVIRINTASLGFLLSLTINLSADSGKSYSFQQVLDPTQPFQIVPLAGQYTYLSGVVGSLAFSAPFQLLCVYFKGATQIPNFSGANSGSYSFPFDKIPATQKALNVRVVNDARLDQLYGKREFLTTGGYLGFADNIDNTYQSPLNITAGSFITIPADAGVATYSIASSSAADTSTGVGAAVFVVLGLFAGWLPMATIAALNGTTPVVVTPPPSFTFARFNVGVLLAGGSGYNTNTMNNSNVGTIYVGTGAFSTVTGFATNYMVARPSDGFLMSSYYTVPAGKRAAVTSLRYSTNVLQSATNIVYFKTITRSSRTSPWYQVIEDTVSTTLVSERTQFGGWMAAGADMTTIVKKSAGSNITANVIVTLHEIVVPYDTNYVG